MKRHQRLPLLSDILVCLFVHSHMLLQMLHVLDAHMLYAQSFSYTSVTLISHSQSLVGVRVSLGLFSYSLRTKLPLVT